MSVMIHQEQALQTNLIHLFKLDIHPNTIINAIVALKTGGKMTAEVTPKTYKEKAELLLKSIQQQISNFFFVERGLSDTKQQILYSRCLQEQF